METTKLPSYFLFSLSLSCSIHAINFSRQARPLEIENHQHHRPLSLASTIVSSQTTKLLTGRMAQERKDQRISIISDPQAPIFLMCLSRETDWIPNCRVKISCDGYLGIRVVSWSSYEVIFLNTIAL